MTELWGRRGVGIVDSKLGPQNGQPYAPGWQEIRNPVFALTVRFKASGSTTRIEHEVPELTGVTHLYLVKANISGIVGAHDNLMLDFNSLSGGRTEVGTNARLIGFPPKPNILVTECNGAANVVVNSGGPPVLLSVYKQPRTINHIGLSITDSDGVPVAYRECVLWFQIDTLQWQSG